MHFKTVLPLILILFLLACTQDRLFPPPEDGQTFLIQPGTLVVNEFVASLSNQRNEFGDEEDWMEVYNPQIDTVFLTSGRWSFTDDMEFPNKYILSRDTFIEPDGYLLIWADSRDTIVTEIHTNFKFSGDGEDIAMYYTDDEGQLITVDSYTFTPRVGGKSEGRFPNGGDNWMLLDTVSPGAPNL